MNKKYLGTEYGGWEVDLDSIEEGDIIIDAGLGEDLSFIEELKKIKNVRFIGIDPTEKSHRYVEKMNLPYLDLIKKAVAKQGTESIKFYKNSNPNYVSESYFMDHGAVLLDNFYTVQCVSMTDIIKKYSPSLIKMDIEGAEYDVLSECIGVKQICVEFHHHCLESKSFDDTSECINMMKSNNYMVISNRNDIEFTFIKKPV